MSWWFWGALIWVGIGAIVWFEQGFPVGEDRSEAEAFLLDSIEIVVCLPFALIFLMHNAMRKAVTSVWNNPGRLGFKQEIHRDRAAESFLQHCRDEGATLRERLVTLLRGYCDGVAGRPTLNGVLSHQTHALGSGKGSLTPQSLVDAHCYALATAIGLNAMEREIDPPSQLNVMMWAINRRIVAEDVGEDYVGHAPSAWLANGVHVQFNPTTLVGGVPSQQQKLTKHYRSMQTAKERLTFMLVNLAVIRAPEDTGLTNLPERLVSGMLSAIEKVDAFWPVFSRSHRLVWRGG